MRLEEETAVSPVVGTVLILAITVAGIAGVLLLGAPTLQRIQDQASMEATLGEFDTLRSASLGLSVTDAARAPQVHIPGGTLALEDGTGFLVVVEEVSGCSLEVTSWDDGDDTIMTTTTGCGLAPTVDVYSLEGATLVPHQQGISVGGITLVPGEAFSMDKIWYVVVTSGGTTQAEAWFWWTDAVTWSLASSSGGDVQVTYEGGALFSRDGGRYFLEAPPLVQESSFGSGDYFLRMPILQGKSSSISGEGTYHVGFALQGQYDRASIQGSVYGLHLSFSGERSEAWCNSLKLRNTLVLGALDGSYSEDVIHPCTADNPVLEYIPDTTPSSFEFIHAVLETEVTI